MAGKSLKRYGLEGAAKALIVIGTLLVLSSWILNIYYFGAVGSAKLFIVPFIFTCALVLGLLVIKYRYTLFENYPYLMNLPSLFYRIGKQKGGANSQSVAFSMIFTVHALVIAFLGLLSLILTISVNSSIQSHTASPILYAYLAIVVVLILSILLQYRRIYMRFVK